MGAAAGAPRGRRDECRAGERPCRYVGCRDNLLRVDGADWPGHRWDGRPPQTIVRTSEPGEATCGRDLDGAELADALGSNPSTLSRWEHDRQPIGRHADLFLRALVLLQQGGAGTPASYFRAIAKDVVPAQLYAFRWQGGKWSVTDSVSVPERKPARSAGVRARGTAPAPVIRTGKGRRRSTTA